MSRFIILLSVGCVLLAVPQTLPGQDAQELQRLKAKLEQVEAKFELLLKENELLRKENALLKKEIGSKGPDKKDDARAGLPTTIHNGVDYEVLSSKIIGSNWELTISAVNNEVKKRVILMEARSITEDGKTYESKRTMARVLDLPIGQKVQIKMDMGPLPASVSMFSTVEFRDGISRGKPMVLKNVRVDR